MTAMYTDIAEHLNRVHRHTANFTRLKDVIFPRPGAVAAKIDAKAAPEGYSEGRAGDNGSLRRGKTYGA